MRNEAVRELMADVRSFYIPEFVLTTEEVADVIGVDVRFPLPVVGWAEKGYAQVCQDDTTTKAWLEEATFRVWLGEGKHALIPVSASKALRTEEQMGAVIDDWYDTLHVIEED